MRISPPQLAKAQAQLQRWQAAKAAGERKRLADEVEDECKSIAWQVRLRLVMYC